jgi:tetrahydromethanopterin S-methyltransferase subunit E
VAIIWTTIGAVVGTIVTARPLDQSSFRGVLWDVGRSVVVALLWGLVTIAAWSLVTLLVALLFLPFPNQRFHLTAIFTITIIACANAVGAVAYGALLWAIVMLLRWTVGGHSRPPS